MRQKGTIKGKGKGRPKSKRISVIEYPVSRINKWLLFDNPKVSEKGGTKKYRDYLCESWGVTIREFNRYMRFPYEMPALLLEHVASIVDKSLNVVFYAALYDRELINNERRIIRNEEYGISNLNRDVSEELEKSIILYRAKKAAR